MMISSLLDSLPGKLNFTTRGMGYWEETTEVVTTFPPGSGGFIRSFCKLKVHYDPGYYKIRDCISFMLKLKGIIQPTNSPEQPQEYAGYHPHAISPQRPGRRQAIGAGGAG
jgi:hypothetical protein